jgi:hypothetical protein
MVLVARVSSNSVASLVTATVTVAVGNALCEVLYFPLCGPIPLERNSIPLQRNSANRIPLVAEFGRANSAEVSGWRDRR